MKRASQASVLPPQAKSIQLAANSKLPIGVYIIQRQRVVEANAISSLTNIEVHGSAEVQSGKKSVAVARRGSFLFFLFFSFCFLLCLSPISTSSSCAKISYKVNIETHSILRIVDKAI